MSTIQAKEKTVSELLRNVKYSIDFYQREYEWQRRHVEELLDDFEARFLASYSPDHERTEVPNYSPYFLGTIITVADNGQSFIVDGQQRLTTLTLLLIFIQHWLKDSDDKGNCRSLIYSSRSGVKSFNINVPERLECMRGLFEHGSFYTDEQSDLSIKNLVARYEDIKEVFPDSLKDEALTYFFDWLIYCVDIVEIKACTSNDAFTIFETMNDRGLNLGQADMLKGYLLANINTSDSDEMLDLKSQANDVWRAIIRDLADLSDNADEDFFKTWLRAKYADRTRERKKGAKNQDYELINRYHRWTRENTTRLGLERSADFQRFITYQVKGFSRHFIYMQRASWTLTTDHEELFYNHHNNFTLQNLLALAPLRLDDDTDTIARKIRLVATFADIFLVRRMVNMRQSGQSTLQYTMFNLAKRIRDVQVAILRDILLEQLEKEKERFQRISLDDGAFQLNQRYGSKIRYLLARMTAHVERECGNTTTFANYMWDAKGRPLEIEHIWATKYEQLQDEFSDESQFQRHRNFFGGLVLLPRGTNQSYGALPYEEKVEHYVKENLLAASLHPKTYENNPNLTNFVKRSGLPFKSHNQFKRADLLDRQELYRKICEHIWDPERLNSI
ncbi:MAG: DUF262 domain-containing protein [Anaerolineaceae bacterium]|nr:DUF262 domain-containing protein [Anaerolineaceae bacterium]